MAEPLISFDLYQYQDRLVSPFPEAMQDAELPNLQQNIDSLLVEMNPAKTDQIHAARRNGALVARMNGSEIIGFSDTLGQRYLASARKSALQTHFVIAGQAFLYAFNFAEGYNERKPLFGASLVTAMAEYAARLQPEYRKTTPWIAEVWGDYVEAHGFMERYKELWYLRELKIFYETKRDLDAPFEWDMESANGKYAGYCDRAIELGRDVFGPLN